MSDTQTQTQTILSPEEFRRIEDRVLTEDGDHERLAHYVTKRALEKAILDGIPTLALCGKLWLPTKDASRFPVCPECKEIFEEMDE